MPGELKFHVTVDTSDAMLKLKAIEAQARKCVNPPFWSFRRTIPPFLSGCVIGIGMVVIGKLWGVELPPVPFWKLMVGFLIASIFFNLSAYVEKLRP